MRNLNLNNLAMALTPIAEDQHGKLIGGFTAFQVSGFYDSGNNGGLGNNIMGCPPSNSNCTGTNYGTCGGGAEPVLN